MRKNIFLILLVAVIFAFVAAISQSARAEEDPGLIIQNSKTPVHFHSLAPGDSLIHNQTTMVGTQWMSIYPSNTYPHTWNCIDQRYTPPLSTSDTLRIQPDAGTTVWVHVERVTVTLKLKKTTSPDTMYVEYSGGVSTDSVNRVRLHPVFTFWHEVRPTFCQWWRINSWHDGQQSGPGHDTLSTCDTLDIVKVADIEWWHVLGQHYVAGLCSLILDQGANRKYLVGSEPPAHPESCTWKIDNPVCTWWREILPPHDTTWWHITSWHDNGTGLLDSCDTIDIVSSKKIEWWHVEDIATDMEVLSGSYHVDTPTMTQWGVIVLAALIVASAVFVMLRKRKVRLA